MELENTLISDKFLPRYLYLGPSVKKRMWVNAVLIVIGWLCVVLGVLGIFLPLLPTTPFLLLAAACFMRSSPKFYAWLVEHPKLGKYIIYYLNGQGIPKRAKIMAIGMIWFTMGISVIWVVPVLWVKFLLFFIGASVSIYLWRQPTFEPVDDDNKPS